MTRKTYRASASAKVILCGEHAVVYGRPAIAVPVSDVRAVATYIPSSAGPLHMHLPDVGEHWHWPPGPDNHPLSTLLHTIHAHMQHPALHGELTVRSDIPIGGGMGSSAAIATAIVRALARGLGRDLPPEEVSAIVFEAERIWHGTPSGVDNTVIAYERPVWFVRGEPPQPFTIARPFTLVIADSGISAPTREVVGDVRRRWEADPARYNAIFDAIAALVHEIRAVLEQGNLERLGPLLNENQRWLEEMGVSSPVLERLIAAARAAGAPGAKLAGAGRGGNIIALTPPDRAEAVARALREAGARATYITTITATG